MATCQLQFRVTDFFGAIRTAGCCALGLIMADLATAADDERSCAPVAEWTVPGSSQISATELLSRAAKSQVVLLGEKHDNADHHRWELYTVAALSALRPQLALGFEMFPRRVQPALDRWVAGELSDDEFLKATDWARVWGIATEDYFSLFHFARLNRTQMIALNVDRDFVREVRQNSFESVPAEKREGVSKPSPASEAYVERLFAVYSEHPEKKAGPPARTDPEFQRFVEAQLIWDGAMAQAIAAAVARRPDALVIGIMGSSHIAYGQGVPHQLDQLGIKNVTTLLPWDRDADCKQLSAGLATAVFGFPKRPPPSPSRPLLGVALETVPEGVRIQTVSKGSVAEVADLRIGDVVFEAAGTAIKQAADLRAAVEKTAPGTWLPLKVKRQNESVELIAKFPAPR